MDNPLARLTDDAQTVSISYEKAKSFVNENTWKQLGNITVEEALGKWLQTLGKHTRINYAAAFRRLTDFNLISTKMNLQGFALTNHESIVDDIKTVIEWSEATRQARAAAYISFTGFLQRRTKGVIRKAVTSKEGVNKTFFKVREKVKTEALSQNQTKRFLTEIETLNQRDGLIAKLILQGGKRKEEVLSLKVDKIDFGNNRIVFDQTKTRGVKKTTVINYPNHVMKELSDYVSSRSGFVFITRNGKRLASFQIDRSFIKAGLNAGIPFRVTPHVLRVTLVTRLKELGVQDTDIMKMTGHANPAQLSSYDKSDLANNASLYHHFV